MIQTFFAASTVKIDSSEQIVVMGERYFKLLVGLLDNTSERDIGKELKSSLAYGKYQFFESIRIGQLQKIDLFVARLILKKN